MPGATSRPGSEGVDAVGRAFQRWRARPSCSGAVARAVAVGMEAAACSGCAPAARCARVGGARAGPARARRDGRIVSASAESSGFRPPCSVQTSWAPSTGAGSPRNQPRRWHGVWSRSEPMDPETWPARPESAFPGDPAARVDLTDWIWAAPRRPHGRFRRPLACDGAVACGGSMSWGEPMACRDPAAYGERTFMGGGCPQRLPSPSPHSAHSSSCRGCSHIQTSTGFERSATRLQFYGKLNRTCARRRLRWTSGVIVQMLLAAKFAQSENLSF